MKKKHQIILLLLICFSAFILFYRHKRITFTENIADRLDYFDVADPEPKHVDVIFSFSGDAPVREREALRLFRKHKNAFWVMSYSKPFSNLEDTLKQKLDTSRIFQIKSLRNTFEEILNLRFFLHDNRKKDILPQKKSKTSIALVSNGYHLKRIQMISNTLLKRYNVSLISAKDNKTNMQNIELYIEEYHDMFFDWWRCFIWTISFGNVAVMAKKNKCE